MRKEVRALREEGGPGKGHGHCKGLVGGEKSLVVSAPGHPGWSRGIELGETEEVL